MKYALMQTEVGDQIKIIDNSTHLGKKKVENLIDNGFKCIGYIESEQAAQLLMWGFNRNFIDKLDERDSKLREIQEIIKR